MDQLEKEPRREVIKHSAAIQIRNNVTLLQRRAWNALLYNAYDALESTDVHHITVRELRHLLDYNSNDEEYLKEIIRALVKCSVEWNVLGKDGANKWGIAALLADAEIANGICTYSYGAQLRKRLHHPSMYARLDLSLQNRFESKHAQALWELSVDYLGAAREYGETPFIPIDQFRRMMCADNGKYKQYRDLNKYVIKVAVDEINKVSDLRVTVENQRQGRKVTAVKFKIRRVATLLAQDGKQASLFPNLENIPTVVKLLQDAGLAHAEAWEIWQKGFNVVDSGKRPAVEDDPERAFIEYIQEKVHLLKERQRADKGVDNPSGFLYMAIRQNYSNAKFEKLQENRAQTSKIQKIRRLLKEKERLKRARDDALQALSDQIVEEDPKQAEEAVAALREEDDAGFKFSYDDRLTGLENYRKHHFVASQVGQWLEEKFSKRFVQARKRFNDQLADIETRIRKMEAEGISAK